VFTKRTAAFAAAALVTLGALAGFAGAKAVNEPAGAPKKAGEVGVVHGGGGGGGAVTPPAAGGGGGGGGKKPSTRP